MSYTKDYLNKIKKNLFRLKLKFRILFPSSNFLLLDRNTIQKNFKNDILFIHIPKCAGSSMRVSLGIIKSSPAVHLRLKDYLSMPFFKKKIKKSFIFAFVRNPFDRFVSGYEYYRKESHRHPEILYFSNFTHFCEKIDSTHYKYVYTFLPQYTFIENQSNVNIDFIGRFEKIDEDYEKIRLKFKLKKLPFKNKSSNSKRDFKDYYTKKTANVIYHRYKKDFDLWYPNAYDELIEYIENKI